ncbi:hypothetical protein IKR55_02800 [bacterium]|jgi:S-adenosylmethionine:diacylglycerol 3-amino-3-carboxypropyl transferase|nr:hypothetical protein [bacterium]
MSIANLQEKLLFFTRQKSLISKRLSDVQMRQLNASKQLQEKQQAFNAELSALYYDPTIGYGTAEYGEVYEALVEEHQFELSSINSWESQLEMEKELYETQLNEITNYENTWQKLLAQNIKVEFTYGGNGGGK